MTEAEKAWVKPLVDAALRCDQHPRYQAKRAPKTCPRCWEIYRHLQNFAREIHG